MTCLNCNLTEAIKDPNIGYLPCANCQKKNHKYEAKPVHEFTTQAIIDDRQKFKKEILQPYRNGSLSKEYVDAFGTSRLNVTPEEVKNAKPVWNDLGYYNE